MTKPISRKMAVNCLLHRFRFGSETLFRVSTDGVSLKCGICGEALEPDQDIQFDHVHADVFDGPHEYQNLRPVHAECHKKKTARDIKDNAKIKRILGETKTRRKRPIPQRANPWPPKGSRKMQSKPMRRQ